MGKRNFPSFHAHPASSCPESSRASRPKATYHKFTLRRYKRINANWQAETLHFWQTQPPRPRLCRTNCDGKPCRDINSEAEKIPIYATYCDNLAQSKSPSISSLYRALLWHADVIICPNEAMINHSRKWHDPERPPKELIIEDPWQVERYPFTQLQAREPCRLIWFGHSSNSQYLLKELPDIFLRCSAWQSFELTILSDQNTGQRIKNTMNQARCRKPWSLRFVPWDSKQQPKQLREELIRAHIALLPSDPNDPRKSAASHNRAVDSVQAGCMTIGSPLPSYLELKKILITTTSFPSAINAAIEQRERLSLKWDQLRESELNRFSPAENQKKWNSAFQTLNKSK